MSAQRGLDLFGREKEAVTAICARSGDLSDAVRILRIAISGEIDQFTADLEGIVADCNRLADAIANMRPVPDREFNIVPLLGTISDATRRVESVDGKVAKLAIPSASAARSTLVSDVRWRLSNLRRVLYDIGAQLRAADPFVNGNVAVVTGEAGIGKTHLLCDLASRRVESGLPTVLLMGQNFLTKEAPWRQALDRLQILHLGPEKFVGALEASAQASNSRALLIVDALDEAEGFEIWPQGLAAFLRLATRSRWIACMVSVRSAYGDTVISGEVWEDAVQIYHRGFGSRSYEATKTYLEHFKVTIPPTPLLRPEFNNGLFLKLFCQGLGNRASIDHDIADVGIAEVFDWVVRDVNFRLSRKLDYNEDANPVQLALSGLAAKLADSKSHSIPANQASEIVDAILPLTGFSRSLYRALVSEGLLLEIPYYGKGGANQKHVAIAYGRFADHLIGAHLLESCPDADALSREFEAGGSLEFLFEGTRRGWRSVLEALCAQIPAKFGRELPQVAPSTFEFETGRRAFLSSITWRSRTSWTQELRNQFERLLRVSEDLAARDVFNVLLSVATLPGHPLNAGYLDDYLRSWSMPDRDARWSVYLHGINRYDDGGPVERLLDWAIDLSEAGREPLGDEIAELASTALAWMFSTSDRSVRDRATKGLVRLLSGRIPATTNLVERFQETDDPYVVERIYAVAYGVATSCHAGSELEALATNVYNSVFAAGAPYPHILLRDYARGVIERAIHLGAEIEVDADLIRPPYSSRWPTLDEKAVDELGHRTEPSSDDHDESYRASGSIRFSVMSWDFGEYVIGAGRRQGPWLKLQLDEDRWVAPDVKRANFEARLSKSARELLGEYRSARYMIPVRLKIVIDGDEAPERDTPIEFPSKPSMTDDERAALEVEATQALQRFIGALSESECDEFFELEGDHRRAPSLDLEWVQRYVLWRAFDLGWTVELFGAFDWEVTEQRGQFDELERVGKKYQWIAYHEAMAHVSDRYQFDSGYSDDPGRHTYHGPWQIHCRDIDPTSSTPVRSRPRKLIPDDAHWSQGPAITDWRRDLSDGDWLGLHEDLPEIAKLLRVNDEDGTEWLILSAHRNWQEVTSGELSTRALFRRYAWLIVNSYLIGADAAEDLLRWSQSVEFWGRWMPESHSETQVFLGEHGWAPAFKETFGTEEQFAEPRDGADAFPYPVVCTDYSYLSEAAGLDCSTEDSRGLLAATPRLINGLDLKWDGRNANFRDCDGNLAAFDPDTAERGESLLVRADLLREYLNSNDAALVWVVIGEKTVLGDATNWTWPGSLRSTGALLFEPQSVGRRDWIRGELRFEHVAPSSQED
ncbi:MAG: hypothetical protein OXP37_02165 [Chloroflexota bacterium]|nr:hypothetical protein [Chloroflexota bacterium]